MVPTQSFSISRRTLDVEDYIDIGRRHAGWIAGPTFFGIIVSICVAFLLPNEYTSKATMQITPAQISEAMVQSTVSTALNERVMQMQTQILSRTELSSIINDPRLLLYKEDLKTKPLEDVIEDMKKAIRIDIVALPGAMGKRASAFDISFTYSDRFKAQQTVGILMNKFDEVNLSTQKTQQDAVKGFVGDELNKAKADLGAANDALTAFKEANVGKLPESTQLNIAREAALTTKISADSDRIFADKNALSTLASNRTAAKARLDFFDQSDSEVEAAMPGSPAAKQNDELLKLNRDVDALEFNLQQARKQYSDIHPEVKNLKNQLDLYKAKRDQLAEQLRAKAEAEAAKPKDAPKKQPNLALESKRQEINMDLARIDTAEKQILADIERNEKEVADYKKESDALNQMLKDSTGLEAPYQDLLQTQKMKDTNYQDLLHKQDIADANSQLLQRKAGENLDVLDNASLPMQPTKPNRYMIIGAGFALSLILGAGMAGLQEAKDTSLKNLKDVRAYTNLPVLCSIPLLENTMLVKRKRRLTYLAWSAAVIVGAAAVTGAVVYYYSVTLKT